MLKEFKEFVMRGNVIDLAVGVIIGAAFGDIVTSLTSNFINPLINSIGGAQVAGSIRLPWVDYTGLDVEAAKTLSLNYGDFITAVINFLIVAFVLFIIVKTINTIEKKSREMLEKSAGKVLKKVKKGKKEEVVETEPETKLCPYCLSEIPYKATKCAHCASDLEEKVEK